VTTPAEDGTESQDTAQANLLIGYFSPEPPKDQN